MRQLTIIAPGKLEWQEVPTPSLVSSKAALIRPIAVGVCDFDRALFSGQYQALPYPIAVGHEIVGVVLEIGPDVRDIKVGMQVALPLHISCGECSSCRSDRTNAADRLSG